MLSTKERQAAARAQWHARHPDSTAYAETQVELIARLLSDVDRTGTEPPDPTALAKVLVLGAALAQSDGNTEAATTFARRAVRAVDWKNDVHVLGVGLLSHVLAETGSCDDIERLVKGVPSWQLPGILVSTAGGPDCEHTWSLRETWHGGGACGFEGVWV